MLDKPASKTRRDPSPARGSICSSIWPISKRPGLLVRIDRPINKDTELIPLVRWQFIGGMPEDQRRAFLFTNVIDSKGRRYDMPVVVGALASSPAIYALGMGRPVEEIGEAWMAAIAHPIPPVATNDAPCQEVVITGDALKTRRAEGAAGAGFDAGLRRRALSHRDALRHHATPRAACRTIGTYRVALKAPDRAVVRMVAREATGAGGYLHWLKYRERKEKMPIAIVVGAAPIVMFTGPQKLAVDVDEMAVAGGAAGEAIRMTRCRTVDLDVPADSEIVVEGLIDCDVLEPEAPFGESNGYVALEAFNMPIEVTAITHKKKPVFAQIISQVTPSESSVIKKVAYEPLFLAHLKTQLGVKGIRRVVMHERLTNLRPVIFLQFAANTPRTEVWRGLNGASTLQSNCGKIVIAVSEDIDPSSMDAVLWSLAYRTNPVDDMHIVPQSRRRAGRAIRRQQDRLRASGRRHAQARRCRRSPCRRANTWSTRAGCGRSLGCRRSTCRRRGTATRSTTGPTPGRPSRAAPRRATGKRPAARR